jgi:predicted N-acetyltransferase YhbS
MNSITLSIRPGIGEYHDAVETMGAQAFGPGRFARAAFRLREGVAADQALSFIALMDQGAVHSGGKTVPGAPVLVGSVLVTPISIGGKSALLLGPLVVDPKYKNMGIGRELMNRAVEKAHAMGHELMILVGDEPYYGRFGFRAVPAGQITLPGPVDPARLLAFELKPDMLEAYRGAAARHVQECYTRTGKSAS